MDGRSFATSMPTESVSLTTRTPRAPRAMAMSFSRFFMADIFTPGAGVTL